MTADALAQIADLAAIVDEINRTSGPTLADEHRANDLLFEARDLDRVAGRAIATRAAANAYGDEVNRTLSRMAANVRQIGAARRSADEQRVIRRASIPAEHGQITVTLFEDRAQLVFDDGRPRKRVENLTRDQAARIAAALTI